MKKLLLLFVAVVILQMISGCTLQTTVYKHNNTASPPETRAQQMEAVCTESFTLSVNDTQQTFLVYDRAFPVLDLIEMCGATLNWSDQASADFELQGKTYLVSIPDRTIHEASSQFNIITVPPGTIDGFVYNTEDNIYVDYATMKGILFILGVDASIQQNGE